MTSRAVYVSEMVILLQYIKYNILHAIYCNAIISDRVCMYVWSR